TICEGYDPQQLSPAPDLVVIGNAISRGNPCVEYVLNHNLPYTSGPQWLHDFLLKDRWVLAVAGTHGKTTTSSMLTWILQQAGFEPGFLVGGVLGNFGLSARLGDPKGSFFVVEADEYDSAFFDKRSKFVHYSPRTLILNNLEFDHADIFASLSDIQRQFHHLVRTVPGIGRIIAPSSDQNLKQTLAMGCWSEIEYFGADGAAWRAQKLREDGSQFTVWQNDKNVGQVHWQLIGDHNVQNALAAIAAANHVGIAASTACQALGDFINTKRRLELKGEFNGVTVYDDFAHHPTAIKTTLEGLRAKVGERRILAVLEPRSNTMKLGVHKEDIAPALAAADEVFLFQPETIAWSVQDVASQCQAPAHCFSDVDELVRQLAAQSVSQDVILIMSNGGFGGLHEKLTRALSES
ncbi:MAG: UDP-N-acetylmuramate:L-alanyl-gamma-D-glutamyl-meso-diaminopimelate ligase, partial [Vibrionaceae bacterium]